jgi:hypothetical protein
MAKFKVGDLVRVNDFAISNGIKLKVNGEVKYIACKDALQSAGATCDKKTCSHIKTHCWVRWPQETKVVSYNEDLLEYDDNQPKDKIEEKKDPYMEEAKNAIKSKIDTNPSFDWEIYTGFAKIYQGKDGKFYRKNVFDASVKDENKTQIQNLDFDAYNFEGLTKPKN